MTFSQKSDVKKHLAHPLKRSHYLNAREPEAIAGKIEQDPAEGAATLLDDREPKLVTTK